jgi:hypothetical protein
MATTEPRAEPAKGIGLGGLLAFAAVAGTVAGVGLSLRQQRELESELDSVLAQGDQLITHVPPGESPVDFMQPDPEAVRGIPPYPGALLAPRRLASAPAVGGARFAMAWFSTHDSVESVVEFYREAFSKLPTPNVAHLFSDNLGYAAFYEMPDIDAGADSLSGLVHMVTAVHSGSQTYVFLSNSQPARFLEDAAVLPGGLELPPGALRVQWVDVGEAPISKRTGFAVVPRASAEEVSSFFAQTFRKNEWLAQPAVIQDGLLTLKASKGPDQVAVMMKSEGSDVRMLITIDNIAVPPQGAP